MQYQSVKSSMSVIKEQNLKLKLASVKCHIIGSVSIEFSVNYGSLVIGMIASIIEGHNTDAEYAVGVAVHIKVHSRSFQKLGLVMQVGMAEWDNSHTLSKGSRTQSLVPS